ncbi:helix-turn-helix domain-containing protein [Metapseudomonas lalkuanensis]|uniref:Helix-turn-helix domain-containing protein n=2 Tax=Metapseudomonas lalkuanensis TaxID=2604832 RepID=A0A5J6QU29_9GAMM|nr:helix-turn-helix domain-containing protein [Pseudomonas lalkuanensis]
MAATVVAVARSRASPWAAEAAVTSRNEPRLVCGFSCPAPVAGVYPDHMLVDESRGSEHRLRSREAEVMHGRHVDRAIARMRQLMASANGADELSEVVGISRRQLDRLFQASQGVTVKAYWTEMRLNHAR